VNAQQQALLYRFLLGLVITEIPVATALLNDPVPDYRKLAIGLLGGLAAALEKWVAPYVFGGLNAAPSDVAHAPSAAAATALVAAPQVVIQAHPEDVVPPLAPVPPAP
jgi:hypothetical protein